MISLVKLIKKFSSRKEGIFKYAIDARGRKTPPWAKKEVWIWGIAALSILAVLIALSRFESDDTKTTSTKTDSRGNILEITTTTIPQDAKNVWDWMGLLGVPLTLVGLGYFLQRLQQSRVEFNQREEALQNYLDRLSELLLDKNLISMAIKHQIASESQSEAEALLNAASDVIRARTLSLLRILEQDGKRKGHLIRFLVEAEVINKFKVSLSNVDLSKADLRSANLCETNLQSADLSGANLSHANLIKAKLNFANFQGSDYQGANLSNANLNLAKLNFADLSGANLNKADLVGSDLSYAKLWLAKLNSANLKSANLSNADLFAANLMNADLTGADLKDSDLKGTNLSNANLSEADLSGTKNWTEAQLTQAKLFKTKLPEGCQLNPNRDAEKEE